MKIVLLRHGKHLLPRFGKMTGSDFHHWIHSYNVAPLDTDVLPSNESLMIAKSCNVAICSTLTRSIESSKKLELIGKIKTSSDFVEVSLPSYNVLNLKLPESFWLVFFRLFGYSPNNTTYEMGTNAFARGTAPYAVSREADLLAECSWATCY